MGPRLRVEEEVGAQRLMVVVDLCEGTLGMLLVCVGNRVCGRGGYACGSSNY